MEKITIHSKTIALDQLLKWAGIIDTGGQIKLLLEDQLIYLNGKLITEKRKKITIGDVLEIKGSGVWQIIHEE